MTYSLTPAIVAPIIGVALSVTRSLVPIREVVSIRANRRLGVRLSRINHPKALPRTSLHKKWHRI